MRILVTRPEEEAHEFARRLAALGHETFVEPLLTVRYLPPHPPLNLGDVQALLVTSTNGVRAFARTSTVRGIPVFAVGAATAEAARAEGFGAVSSADGDAEDLVRLVMARLNPAAGVLLHVRGEEVARDLAKTLGACGFAVRPAVLYRAQAAASLSPELARELEAGAIDVATFFSPRSAATFVNLIERARLSRLTERIAAVALSEAVAASLRPLRWRRLLVASEPNQESLIDRIGEAAA